MGIDDENTQMKVWHASCWAHEAAVSDKRSPPEIPQSPDDHMSRKPLEAFYREITRRGY
jgi:hypothetical protein